MGSANLTELLKLTLPTTSGSTSTARLDAGASITCADTEQLRLRNNRVRLQFLGAHPQTWEKSHERTSRCSLREVSSIV